MTREHRNLVIHVGHLILAEWIASFADSVTYYGNLSDPEFKEHRGYSIADKYFQAKERHEKEYQNFMEYSHAVNMERPPFKEIDHNQLVRALKQVIGKAMRNGYGYSSNWYLMRYYYSDAIIALNMLRAIEPDYEAVTARYFSNY